MWQGWDLALYHFDATLGIFICLTDVPGPPMQLLLDPLSMPGDLESQACWVALMHMAEGHRHQLPYSLESSLLIAWFNFFLFSLERMVDGLCTQILTVGHSLMKICL